MLGKDSDRYDGRELTSLQLFELGLQLLHFFFEFLLLHCLGVFAGKHVKIDVGNFGILAVELVHFADWIRRKLRVACIVTKFVIFASLLVLHFFAFLAEAELKIWTSIDS